MKVVMDITLYCNNPKNRHVLGVFRKEFESDIIPTAGAQIEDPVWHDPKAIQQLVLSYVDNCYYVNFGLEDLPKEDHYEMYQKMYKSHGWQEL